MKYWVKQVIYERERNGYRLVWLLCYLFRFLKNVRFFVKWVCFDSLKLKKFLKLELVGSGYSLGQIR